MPDSRHAPHRQSCHVIPTPRHIQTQIETLREQYETGQEGWRAAIAERARKELGEREAALRDRLARERDAEIEVGRLSKTATVKGMAWAVVVCAQGA